MHTFFNKINSGSTGTTPPEGTLTTRRFIASVPPWTPRLSHGNHLVSVRDSAESEDTALALSQAFLLPGDIQKEVENSPDKFLSLFMVNNVKVSPLILLFMSLKLSFFINTYECVQSVQKMVATAQKLDQVEP